MRGAPWPGWAPGFVVLIVLFGSPAPAFAGLSFERPFGGFDLGAARHGRAVFARDCASCHGIASVAPVDLLGLGLSADAIRAMGAVAVPGPGPGPRPAAAARAPDLSRWMIVHGDGVAFLRGLLATDHGGCCTGTGGRSLRDVDDVATFLAWVAAPHRTERRRTGVAMALFMTLLIVLVVRATRQHARKDEGD